MVTPCKALDHPITNSVNTAVEPKNPDNALTLYTDAPSDHPVLKTSHSGRYCMI
jgi:hypothetical protein